MNKPEFITLFNNFLANKSTAAELELLFAYFGTADEAELRWLILDALENSAQDIESAQDYKNAPHPDFIIQDQEVRLAAIHDRLSAQLFGSDKKPFLRSLFNTRIIKAAAIIVAVVSFSLLIYRLSSNGDHQVLPGGIKGALVINGMTKNLHGQKSAMLYRDHGITISTQKDGTIVYSAYDADSITASQVNILETPRGGEYRVTLSDGSVVRLNAGSKLSFPTGFRGAERRVALEGEAFFEVAKNPEMPFIVTVNETSIRVLGTKFNVSSYKEDINVTATLLEGSILFSDKNNHQAILKPNQQASSQGGKITISNVEAADYAAWTKGDFLFNDMPVTAVMQKLGRWYDVDVDLQSLPDKHLYLKISRTAAITDVLKLMSKATNLQFKLEGNKIVMKPVEPIKDYQSK